MKKLQVTSSDYTSDNFSERLQADYQNKLIFKSEQDKSAANIARLL